VEEYTPVGAKSLTKGRGNKFRVIYSPEVYEGKTTQSQMGTQIRASTQMTIFAYLFALALCVSAPTLSAGDACCAADRTAPTAPKDSAWREKARTDYPLKTCVVSGEELGGMGESEDYIYRQKGKPDRLVRFCCGKCKSKFEKDPARYLKVIDEAGAKAGKP